MTSPEVVMLPFDVVNRIIDLAESPPRAREAEDHTSPMSRRDVPELPKHILCELKKKTYANVQSYWVSLQPGDRAIISQWCRNVGLPKDADIIDNATT